MNERTFGCITAVTKNCPCGSRWSRHKDPTLPHVSAPVCPECGKTPHKYELSISHAGKKLKIKFDKQGNHITSIPSAIELGLSIGAEIRGGTFNLRSYKKRTDCGLGLNVGTLSDFIEYEVMIHRQHEFLEEELEFMQEFVAAFFEDHLVYRITQTHIQDFMQTFDLRGHRKEWATGLINRVLGFAYRNVEGCVA